MPTRNFMKTALAAGACALFTAPIAMADAITDWNERGVAAGYTARISPDMHSRCMAILHLGMFEAVNAIEPRYTPYRAIIRADRGASREAAAVTAARDVMVKLFPEQAKESDSALQEALSRIADGPAKAEGIRVGQQAAAVILAERGKDNHDAPILYRPFTTPGTYVPTPFPASSTWGAVHPFTLKSRDQFRPPAPYALTSAQWATDYNEIRTLGAKTGSRRSPEQTEIARFWQLIGPATYNPVTRQVAMAKQLDLLDNARVFALSAMATADAAVAVFDAKYAYNFWRPVTAIRLGDTDGNDATPMDAAWEPFAQTPMHPEYPCAHCIFQGSAASVLQTLYGDSVPRFTLTSTTAPGVTRSFDKLSDYVADVVNGRVYEGVHYRTSGEVGADMGHKIGENAVRNFLTPLR